MVEPDYYAEDGLSPLKAFEQGLMSKEQYIGFLKGNVIKYTVRAGKKDDPLMDIFKAIDYLHYLHKALTEDKVNPDEIFNEDNTNVEMEDVVASNGELQYRIPVEKEPKLTWKQKIKNVMEGFDV